MTSPVRAIDLDAVPKEPTRAVLALGSNLGDRMGALRAAVAALGSEDGLEVVGVSPVVETDPVGGPEQEPYLNAVVLVRCTTSPRDLLAVCRRVEDSLGRERTMRWGPRTLDVDVIAYGSLVSADDELTLPHPRAHERAFVLAPWAELDRDAALPGPHGGPVASLAAQAPDAAGLRPRPDLSLDDAR